MITRLQHVVRGECEGMGLLQPGEGKASGDLTQCCPCFEEEDEHKTL